VIGFAGDAVIVAVHALAIAGLPAIDWRHPRRADFVATSVICGRNDRLNCARGGRGGCFRTPGRGDGIDRNKGRRRSQRDRDGFEDLVAHAAQDRAVWFLEGL
jgi:hypothetical protein